MYFMSSLRILNFLADFPCSPVDSTHNCDLLDTHSLHRYSSLEKILTAGKALTDLACGELELISITLVLFSARAECHNTCVSGFTKPVSSGIENAVRNCSCYNVLNELTYFVLDKCLSLGEIAFFPLFPSHVYSFDVSRCLLTADMNCFSRLSSFSGMSRRSYPYYCRSLS